MEQKKEIFLLNKKVGETPLNVIENFQKKNPNYKNIKMSYAGRLDPMAEGLMLIICGDKLKNQDKYRKLDKEYIAEILLGISTDSGDVLGIPGKFEVPKIPKNKIRQKTEELEGKIKLPLPAYSSYRIKGKPLFWWAKQKRLKEIEIPKREMNIYKIEMFQLGEISEEKIITKVIKKISAVKGDFRQEEIKKGWQKRAIKNTTIYPILKIKVKCASGTYIRSLAEKLGKKLKTKAMLLGLKRTGIGKYTVK